MKKGVKTTLIVALSLFCTGVVISLIVSVAVGFDYRRLNVSGTLWGENSSEYITSENGTEREAVTEPKLVENSFKAEGQNFSLKLVSSDVSFVPSEDGEIHIRYYENNWLWYDFSNENGEVKLVERHPNGLTENRNSDGFNFTINFGFFDIFGKNNGIFFGSGNDSTNQIEISLPAKWDGSFEANSTSGSVSVSGVSPAGGIKFSSTSGDIYISQSQTAGELRLQTVSGEISLNSVQADDLQLSTTSGDIELTKTVSSRANLQTTSGDMELNMPEFEELIAHTVSGELDGTVPGEGKDYTVYFSSVSGSNSLRNQSGRGGKTIDFTSVSGDLDISFSRQARYDVDDEYDD